MAPDLQTAQTLVSLRDGPLRSSARVDLQAGAATMAEHGRPGC
jgi:hypothetical protein